MCKPFLYKVSTSAETDQRCQHAQTPLIHYPTDIAWPAVCLLPFASRLPHPPVGSLVSRRVRAHLSPPMLHSCTPQQRSRRFDCGRGVSCVTSLGLLRKDGCSDDRHQCDANPTLLLRGRQRASSSSHDQPRCQRALTILVLVSALACHASDILCILSLRLFGQRCVCCERRKMKIRSHAHPRRPEDIRLTHCEFRL